ncbi:MAG: 1-acyl-sn-glycerol-3-phosphate acyltransferase [Firmicutes bacterium]|nr:1-acyl-sn-glycerol-3-phosphate acyltransferase [Bacillota bacterium]
MLFWGIILLSAAISVAICAGAGGFGSLAWLWMLPAGFVGSYLVLALAAFLFLVAACRVVDLEKPQEADSRAYRKITRVYVRFLVKFARVRVHTQGLEQLPSQGRFLLVCNHLNDVDPVLLLDVFADSQLAFVSKQENRDMFVVGKLMHKLQCQMLNRDDDRQALLVIRKCAEILKEDKASIAVFPEGYCSTDGLLHHFRSGVFKIAQKAKVPIVVCTVRNTKAVIPNLRHLRPTDVHLHLVGVLPVSAMEGQTTVAISQQVHRMMAEDLGPGLTGEE